MPGKIEQGKTINEKFLLLFDVDCTLIHTGGAGTRAVNGAVTDLFGPGEAFSGVEFAGRTDILIVTDGLKNIGVEPSQKNLELVRLRYVDLLEIELKASGNRARTLDGVGKLLEKLAGENSFTVGLLTGNWKEGARKKLSHFGLWRYFFFGAFAEDGPERDKLFEPAITRASDFTSRNFSPAETWVIGDTPHDVKCGKSSGANTIAVATGPYDREALEKSGATAVLDDLSDTMEVIGIITNRRYSR